MPSHRKLIATALFVCAASQLSAQRPAQTDNKETVKQYIPYEKYSQADNERIIKLFDGLRVADVSDGMDEVGLASVGLMSTDIKTLWRDTDNFTHQIRGIAVTCRYVPTNKRQDKMPEQDVSRWYRELTSEAFTSVLHPGSVLVIDGDEDGDTRTIGSSNIKQWMKRGAVGVVTSGGVGDTDEIIHQKIPLYYKRLGRGFRPGRNELESVNRPVTMGGVLVRPGDVIIADGDGVIVVPREHAEAVAKAARPYLDNIGLDRMKQKKQ
jgi:4-hydroxy-4-methyl-2-oxoglutarate aldolase